GQTLYYDTATGEWSAYPMLATCDRATSQDSPGYPVAHCTNFSGSLTYSVPPTLMSGSTSWTMSLAFDCIGSPALAGHYSLTFSGTGSGSCPHETGTATYA